MSEEQPRLKYLNTDLDLVCERNLMPLTTALNARGVYPLSVQQGGCDLWYSTLEVNSDVDAPELLEPESTILVMLDAIEAIDGEAKRLWSECSKREFNIGYDCGDEPRALCNGLTNSTLSRIASLGASLGITLYSNRSK
jgi:hypothetical protein